MKPRNMKQGFTLIEAIVSTALFAFVVSAIIGVYISVLRLDTRTRALRAVAADSRFIMDFLAKEIRNGRIDYASYPPGNSGLFNTDIYLINQSNEAEHIYCNGTASPPGHLTLVKGAGTINLNSNKVQVMRCSLFVSPIVDPFTGITSNQQPHVTVVLELRANYNTRDRVDVNLQSTFSTLYYPPRP